jgi:predicted site-specific integrase-resolvase
MTTQSNTANSSTTPDTLPSEGFIRVMPLSRLLGIHHQTLRRWWRMGQFPRPQRRNGILLFKNSEVKHWIDNQPQIIA